uniref:Ubiquitin-like domain-containing protein n=1 Tax=Meloidogyne enterolobii TaxID=390850 RepID=A0A6V7UUR2_MELEN|nr:unnamed protein product [Meloidogyne enterolobii]
MQLFVKTLDGKTLIFDFDASDTAEHVKLKIQNLENTPVEEQRLICAGVQLQDGNTLADYKLEEHSTVHLSLRNLVQLPEQPIKREAGSVERIDPDLLDRMNTSTFDGDFGYPREKKIDNMILNFGPNHPAAHGVLRLILKLEGELKDKISEDDKKVLDRCQEKLSWLDAYIQMLFNSFFL